MSQSYSCLTEVGKSSLRGRVVFFDVIHISFVREAQLPRFM